MLLPALGVEGAILAITLGYGAIGALLWSTIGSASRFAYAVGAALVVGVGLVSLGSITERLFDSPVKRYAVQRDWSTDTDNPPPRLAAAYEGLTETILYLEMLKEGRSLYHVMFMNSVSMADTEFQSRRYMKLYVYWPMAVPPRPEEGAAHLLRHREHRQGPDRL